MTRRNGFTLIELLVVITIIGMLATILLPSLTRIQEIGYRTVCAKNLKNIGEAMMSYAAEYDGRFPSIATGQNTWNVVGSNKTSFTNEVTDGTRPLFMLMVELEDTDSDPNDTVENWVRTETKRLTAGSFNCPALASEDRQLDPIEWTDQVGFDSYNACSYSYQHSLNPAVIQPPNAVDDGSTRVVAADRSPLAELLAAGKADYDNNGRRTSPTSTDTLSYVNGAEDSLSRNHGDDGHNLLYADAHVVWTKDVNVTTSSGVTSGFDNIWLPEGETGSTIFSKGPTDETDIFLVP